MRALFYIIFTFAQMVNILPMVKIYLFPFCKGSVSFGNQPQNSGVRFHPVYPSDWSLNYHEYQVNWTLRTRSFFTRDSSTNLFFFLVLFLLPTNLWNYLCLVIVRLWRSPDTTVRTKNSFPMAKTPKVKRPPMNPCFVHGKKEPSFRGNLTFSGSLGNF